jgi:glycosyltransferase involved in cell wall biosynthesis
MSASKHRVLFLTFWYPSEQHPSFGVFIKEHAKAIQAVGVEVQLCAYQFKYTLHPFRKLEKHFTDDNGVKTHLLVIESFFYRFIQINPWHNFLFLRKFLSGIYKEFPFTIIHANVVSPCGVVAMLLARYFKLPYIITEHWTRLRQYLKNNKLSFMGKKAYRRAFKITAVSKDLQNTIVQAFKVPIQHVQVVPNVVDTDIFKFTDTYTSHPHLLRFVFVGNLRPPKRPDIIVKALELLYLHTDKAIVLHIFGSGKMQSEIDAQKGNIEIIWHGVQPKHKIAQVLNESDLLLHASELETFCLAVAEAICCGTPVVVSNLAVLGELINPTHSGLMARNTPEDFFTKIQEALQMPWNRHELANKNGKRFTPSSVGAQFRDLYDSIPVS